MGVITFFGRAYTGAGQLAEKASEILKYRVVDDRELIETAAREYGLDEKDIEASIYKAPPVPEQFSAGKARCIAAVKSVVARNVEKGEVIFNGFLGELIPSDIGLHLLVTASDAYRLRRLRSREENDQRKAADILSLSDEAFLRWSLYLKTAENREPSDCDGVINASRTGRSELIGLISEAAERKGRERDPGSFRLAARVSRLMAEKGHPVAVSARGDRIRLRVNKPVMMLSRYGKKLSSLARSVEGVGKASAQAGPTYYRADVLSGHKFVPSPNMAVRPLKKEYEQLYAQVADQPRAFLYSRAEKVPPLTVNRPIA